MAICNALTAGLTKSCETNSGGVNKIYITDFENVTSVTIGASTAPQVGDWIDAITMASPGGVTASFYEFQTNKNVCLFQETVAIDMTAGTTFFNQVFTLVLSRRETTKRTAIEKLVAGQKQLSLLITDSNGNTWYSGLSEGSYVTAIDGGTGTAKADANGYTITFTAMEPLQAYGVDPTIIAAITAI
jgi:hypothetical protein